MSATAADVVGAARGHLGTPWQHQGRLPGVALDCAGLIICVARQLGLVAPDWDVNGYARMPDGTMLDWCDQHMQRAPEIELGAVLVLKIVSQPQHLGIVGDYRHGGWSLIHGAANEGRVIETRLMFRRTLRLVRAYRLPGVH
jgi:cell wall-associated NlpC family hydrolase